MTEITELVQREKFEAWARSQQLSLTYGDCGYVYSSTEMAWRAVKALSAELVEALEKAQQRIVELESRTITVKQYDEFQICHYGATEDYAKGYIDCQNNFSKWLTAAGIKLEQLS